jgi:branched-chain amino acid transport system permease protein
MPVSGQKMSEVKSPLGVDADVSVDPGSGTVGKRSKVRVLLSEPVILSVLAVAFLAWTMEFASSALTFQLTEVLVAILFAVAVSYVMGVSGTPAFGNQLFYAGAAYLVAIMTTRWNMSDVLLLCGASILLGVVMGGILALLLKRITGVAFGMVTLAISQIAYVYVGITDYLGSDNGLSGISAGTFFGISLLPPADMILFVWACVVLGVVVIALVRRSRLGLLTQASRDSTSRASAIGIPTFRYHAIAFILGAACCGLAGALTAISVGTVDQDMFYWTAGAAPILAGLLGGIRTIKGPIVGAIILSIITVWVSTLTTSWLLIEGVITLGVFLIWPQGLLGEGSGSGLTAARHAINRIFRAKKESKILPS